MSAFASAFCAYSSSEAVKSAATASTFFLLSSSAGLQLPALLSAVLSAGNFPWTVSFVIASVRHNDASLQTQLV